MPNPDINSDLSAAEKRQLLKQLLQTKVEEFGTSAQFPPVSSQTASPKGKSSPIPEEFYNFRLYPQYQKLQEQFDHLQSIKTENPYFKAHQGITNNITVIDSEEYINFSSYNYLGLSGEATISQAAKEAIDRYGTSVSASRIASGEKPLHRQLEGAVGNLLGVEDAIVFVSGYSTNVSTIGHLFGPNDLLIYDSLIHASIHKGALLSGAQLMPFPHNDWEALNSILQEQRHEFERVLIVIEGVYSMDGDIPDLPRFIEIKNRHKVFLMVDEAHSMGVLGEKGQGIREYYDVDPASIDIWMGTLSKSFASCGGYIGGTKALIQTLKYSAPGFVYSVGISPANAAAALAAIQILKKKPERVMKLQKNAKFFFELAKEKGLNTGQSANSPVIPIIVGNSDDSLVLADRLFAYKINVQPIFYPAVNEDQARLRFFITSLHTEKQIRFTIDTVSSLLNELKR